MNDSKKIFRPSRDSIFIIKSGDTHHIISENYAYKTESYYSILQHEIEGKSVKPSSIDILDAYIVPLCLEKAKLNKIPTCQWGISNGYTPLPAIMYGLNYFSTTSEFSIVYNAKKAEEARKHITNIGKYPFCYQKLNNAATVHSCVGIFGQTTNSIPSVINLVKQIYDTFTIPLITITYVKDKKNYLLSSLSPVKYSNLLKDERKLLTSYINNQETI